MRRQNCMKQKSYHNNFFLKFFPCKRSNDGVFLVVKAAAVSNSTTRLTWHFSHVPSKQNRVYGPCFYLDYAPQAAKLHQSNFLLGLLLREKKEVMRSTGGVSYHVLLTLFPPFRALLLKNICMKQKSYRNNFFLKFFPCKRSNARAISIKGLYAKTAKLSYIHQINRGNELLLLKESKVRLKVILSG